MVTLSPPNAGVLRAVGRGAPHPQESQGGFPEQVGRQSGSPRGPQEGAGPGSTWWAWEPSRVHDG